MKQYKIVEILVINKGDVDFFVSTNGIQFRHVHTGTTEECEHLAKTFEKIGYKKVKEE